MCLQCQYGLFLLANKTLTNNYPSYFSFCVPSCRLAHSSYIDDLITGKCHWCGTHCNSCNLKTGCEYCLPEEAITKVGWVTAPDDNLLPTYSSFKYC